MRPTSASCTDPVLSLKAYLSALPTPTAVQSAISTLTRLVLVHTTRSLACSHVVLGTSLTSLSINLISSIAQGGGFNVPEESFEEWQCDWKPPGSEAPSTSIARVRVVRPLQDIGMKECSAWAWWHSLSVPGHTKLPLGGRQSIGGLTKGVFSQCRCSWTPVAHWSKDFIVGLERDYPSTVSAIAKTCAKLTTKTEVNVQCLVCGRLASVFFLDDHSVSVLQAFYQRRCGLEVPGVYSVDGHWPR